MVQIKLQVIVSLLGVHQLQGGGGTRHQGGAQLGILQQSLLAAMAGAGLAGV